MTKSKKGKKGGAKAETGASGSQQEQPGQSSSSQPEPSQKQGQPRPQQQQQQRQPGPQQQQQQRQLGPQQQQQQRQPGPQQQQQQRQLGPQQQQRQPGPQQQQRQPGPQQQQQQQPVKAWQQRPPGPQQQPPGAWQQQQRPPGPPQEQQVGAWQQRPPGPQQQQQSHGPWQQQQRPPGPPQQQQQQPVGPWQQRPPGPQQQPPGAWQQQQRPPGPPQEQVGAWQQRPPGPQQQQQPHGPWQQQQRPPGPPQQQQQQQPVGPWQQKPPGLQQHQQPHGPWQQQPRPAGPPQQQQPAGIPQQQALPDVQKLQIEPHASQQQQPPSEPLKQPEQFVTESQVEKVDVSYGVKVRNGRAYLSTALQQMYTEQIPKRSGKGGGKIGRPITVQTNMLRINFNSQMLKDIVHYDVVIEPDKPKFLMRHVFEAFRKMHFPQRYPAFDGKKNAYSAKNLPFGDQSPETEIKVFDSERQTERSFKIYLKKAAVLDLSWLMNISYGTVEYQPEQAGLQALDIILRHGPANRCVTVGRSLFPEPEPGRVVSLTNGMQLWVGVFQSAVVGWRPYLNIDVAHKGFPTAQPVINLMKELCTDPRSRTPLQSLHPNDVHANAEKITKFLKGLKVQYEIPGQSNTKRTYRVNGLAECPRNNKFESDSGPCTVENYFMHTKRYRLQFPDLPCLWVGSRTNAKKIHLPVELCTVVAGQVTQKKLDENQTSKMIREAATDTHTRKAKIMDGFAKMNLNEQPTLAKEFRLSVQGEFEKVPARVLEAPKLLYYDKKEVNVMKGTWHANRFLNPSSLAESSWTILNLDKYTNDRDLYTLHDKLMYGAKNVGMTIGKAITPFTTTPMMQRNINAIIEYFKQKKGQDLRLVVVVIPNVENAYSLVKQVSELKITGGLVTQCLKSATLRKLTDATITNILLKINSKLNGINHSFAPTHKPPCLQVPCMLIGADVTHPSPDAINIPSIAAVAASHDPKAFQYNIELRLQSPREEMIKDLEEIMRKQLTYFYTKTHYKPRKIIFYRDGVSEGQLSQVMHFELTAIKKALAKLENSDTHKIPITFLVVQKRHHIRLFPTDRRNSDDRNFNVQAGTIVDTEITHPTHIDFYLVSHASIQGTARPTKYRCICNENQLSEDEIEQLTYYLCHMFARCTRSVSYPAPTYYAHLAAFRARAWIHGVSLNIEDLPREQKTKMTMQMENSPMFFV